MTKEEARAIFKAHVETAMTEWMMKTDTNVLDEAGQQWVAERAMDLTRAAMEYGGGYYQKNAEGGITINH